MPKAHINLLDSKFGISFIDVSQSWKGYDATVLNLIASRISRGWKGFRQMPRWLS